MLLFEIINQRMVVALAALQVHPQKETANIASKDIGISVAFKQKPSRWPCGRVGSISRKNLPNQHVVGSILGECLQ